MADVQLSPTELDLLEDALEDLELDGALDRFVDDATSPRVRERLEGYRSILVASREVLPLEDVRAGVLDDVLAEANRAAAVAPVATISQGSWWSRIRRSFMVPTLALAGTAALVLLVFDPEEQATLADRPPATPTESAPASAAKADESPERSKAEDAEEEDRQREAPEQSAVQAATPAAQPAPPAFEPASEGEDRNLEAKLAEDADKDAKPKASGGMGSLGDVPGGALGGTKTNVPQEQTGAAAGPASGRWDIVARADRARQSGDCVAARQEYSLALEDDDPRVRARAFAGLGLCDAKDGDDAGSEANFERARELDGDMSSFIDSQQQRARPAKKRKSKKSSSKKSMDLGSASDPFSP